MAEMWESVVETLQSPDVIRRSNSDPYTVRLYYKWFVDTVVGARWVCVVVKYRNNDAFVLTAYATDVIKEGEEIWPK
jgi:hypothetical protein